MFKSSNKGEESLPLTGDSQIKPMYFAPEPRSSGEPLRSNAGTINAVEQAPPQQRGGGFLSRLFGRGGGYQAVRQPKPRKVPVKVEPKVFFANERTFLAWLNMSVTLSSIAIAILAFGDHNEFSQIYGFIVLPVAIAFCIYALRTYIRRSSMIRRRDPGPYEDKFGPTALTILLVLSILVNMGLKLYDILSRPSSSSLPSPSSPSSSRTHSVAPSSSDTRGSSGDNTPATPNTRGSSGDNTPAHSSSSSDGDTSTSDTHLPPPAPYNPKPDDTEESPSKGKAKKKKGGKKGHE